MRFPEYLEKLHLLIQRYFLLQLPINSPVLLIDIETSMCHCRNVKREGLGDDNMMKLGRIHVKLADEIVIGESILHFQPEFSSITLQGKTSFDGGEEVLISRSDIYNKQTTNR